MEHSDVVYWLSLVPTVLILLFGPYSSDISSVYYPWRNSTLRCMNNVQKLKAGPYCLSLVDFFLVLINLILINHGPHYVDIWKEVIWDEQKIDIFVVQLVGEYCT